MLSKNLRTHKIIFKDGEVINVTQSQYELIKTEVEVKKHNDFITIIDIDTKEVLFNGRCNEILRFEERKRIDAEYSIICGFGNRHKLINGKFVCDCEKNYGYTELAFKEYMRDNKNKVYSNDFTAEDRKEFYLYNKNKIGEIYKGIGNIKNILEDLKDTKTIIQQ